METSPRQELDLAIVGGGISGLTAAWRATELQPKSRMCLFEASDRLGGVLETVRQDGFLIERSADSFITDQKWVLDLCGRLGIEADLVPTSATERRAFVVRHGKLVAIPDGFQIMAATRLWPIFMSPLLSFKGKIRLAFERFVPRRDVANGDESLADFATRRLGREAYERLVQPLVGGIYTADARLLSISAALPRFADMEQEYGSITRGLLSPFGTRRGQSPADAGARYSLFMTPRDGVEHLVREIRQRLPDEAVSQDSKITSVAKINNHGWELTIAGNRRVACRKLVLATPAHVSARLMADADPVLADELDSIPYAGCVLVCLGFAKSQFQRPLAGFGFVVPAIENRKILAASFSSAKFPGRAPDDHVLVRVFVGGACQPELIDLPDAELRQMVLQELGELTGLTGQPVTSMIARWPRAMPQYHVGHVAKVDRIERHVADLGNLVLAGNAYHGVGISHCIHTAETAVERLLDQTG